MIRVAIADDHQMFVAGIASFVSADEEIQVVVTANSGQQLLASMREHPVDVLVVDMEMPFDPNQPSIQQFGGIQIVDAALNENPDLRVLVLTMHVNEELVLKMLDNGANGYLQKISSADYLVQAIKIVYRGGYFFNELVPPLMVRERLRRYAKMKLVSDEPEPSPLSPREKEVMHLMVEGITTKEIADKLHVSEGTIASHRNNIFVKLGVRNQAELVATAFRNRWVS